ncbi:hypothetical protein BO99DRAFT_443691 [Aspergillus violaceofuscus CBS 115571]|uniref:Uncharacterized protein n=1 Tax=Aspergillus violaceofuscus (strain CBS 115571) TaxID=1450538 RepID=A0A2V5IG39_ASPV1|nr:hypothetical protein BO99DRAFT_443691 [Aspergillus violaceofuscus CBS 115571]
MIFYCPFSFSVTQREGARMRLLRRLTIPRKPIVNPRSHGPHFHPWYNIPQTDTNRVTIPKSPPLTDVSLDLPPDLLRRNQENYLTYISRLLQRFNSRTWGFPIFRAFSTSASTAEVKEKLWSAYLPNLFRGVYTSFREHENFRAGQAQLYPIHTNALFPRFYCPVIQPDVPILHRNGDGGPGIGPATRDAIRNRLATWVSNTTEERDGPEQFQAAHTDEERHGAPNIVLERDWTLDKYRGFYRAEWTDGETHKEPPDEPQ